MPYVSSQPFMSIAQPSLGRRLTTIDCYGTALRFLIVDSPTESTLDHYMEQFFDYDVSMVVRCCPPAYNAQRLIDRHISVYDLVFKDGGVVCA